MEFKEAIELLTVTTIETLNEDIRKEHNFIAFMGFEGCPFCRRFAPKLKEALEGRKAYFISSRETSDLENITKFRNYYHIPTVPALLVFQAGKLNIVCDSTLSVDDIKALIHTQQ